MSPFIADATPLHAPVVQLLDVASHRVVNEWNVVSPEYQGGLAITSGDFGGDGTPEIVVAESGGPEARGIVRLYREDHSLITTWLAFSEISKGEELSLASGDVDADGTDELFIARPDDVKGRIFVFQGNGVMTAARTIDAFGDQHRGARIAIANVVGDDRPEIIAVSAHGPQAMVRLLDARSLDVIEEWQPLDSTITSGLSVTAANLDDDPFFEVVVGYATGGSTTLQWFDADTKPQERAKITIWSREFQSGVQFAAMNVSDSSYDELVVTPMGDQRGEMVVVRSDGSLRTDARMGIFSDDFRGGVAVAPFDHNRVLVAPRSQVLRGDVTHGQKYVEVNLTQQVERVWEDGFLRNVFLISSGMSGTPSPQGTFSIIRKKETVHFFGPGYDLPNTPWNMLFKDDGGALKYYLHGAYWHNNFGHPMSHGCINMRIPDAKFLYDWSDIGTLVWIHV